jgi:DNA modification methylase
MWLISREYHPARTKNKNKLPDSLVEKMVQYSSRHGDVVCDFFLGNFTTAYVAGRLGREVWGFEVNPLAFPRHATKLVGRERAERWMEIDRRPRAETRVI